MVGPAFTALTVGPPVAVHGTVIGWLTVPASRAELDALVRAMQPVLHEGVFVFALLPPGMDPGRVDAVATVQEAEGLTVVVKEPDADDAGLTTLFRAAWITLEVRSDLEAVGLTAAVATALADEGIACNVIAGVHHDHLFVPAEKGELALLRLRRLAGEGLASGR